MTTGTQISDMTDSLTVFPDGCFVPFIVETSTSGLVTTVNYRYNAGLYLAKLSTLAANGGAELIGTSDSITVQAALTARPTSATLAASGGSALIGFTQRTIGAGTPVAQTVQDKGRQLVTSSDYTGGPTGITGVGVDALNALNATGFGCTAVGSRALKAATTVKSSVAIGDDALMVTTTGDYNTAVGSGALAQNIDGHTNVAVGLNAMNGNLHGTNNVGVGKNALVAMIGTGLESNNNTAVGDSALQAMTKGYNNVSIGSDSMSSGAGFKTGNAALGTEALTHCDTGLNNAAVGTHTLHNLTTGNSNCGMGYYTGDDITTGNFNTLIGYQTGGGITTGSKNTILGANVSGLSAGLTGDIILADGDGNIKARYSSSGDNWTFAVSYTVMEKLLLQGGGLAIKTGSNRRMGTAVLVAGTVTVANTSVGANDKLFLSRHTVGGTPGFLSYTLSTSTSLTINSSDAADTSTVDWLLIEGF